jgi:hypothetical protein
MTTRASQVSCRTAPAIDHTEPFSIAAKPASSPDVLRHLCWFFFFVTSLETKTVLARRCEHGLSDGVWYASEALPCMVESNDASALCVRFGLSHDVLLLLPTRERHHKCKGRNHQGPETVQVFKDKRKLPCQNALVKHVHIRTPACHRDTNTSYRTVQADMVIRSGEYSEYKYEYSPT